MDESQDKLYATTLQTIGAVSKLPIVRVDRKAFLRKQFANSPHLEVILADGPQAVFTPESLRKKSNSIIEVSTAKTSAASFAASASISECAGLGLDAASTLIIC